MVRTVEILASISTAIINGLNVARFKFLLITECFYKAQDREGIKQELKAQVTKER